MHFSCLKKIEATCFLVGYISDAPKFRVSFGYKHLIFGNSHLQHPGARGGRSTSLRVAKISEKIWVFHSRPEKRRNSMGFQFALIISRLTSHEILFLSSCLKSRKKHHLASTFFKNGSKCLVRKTNSLGGSPFISRNLEVMWVKVVAL